MFRYWWLVPLLAAVLLLIGVTHGIPYWIVNDEFSPIGGALRILELRNPFPSMNPGPMQILYYPPGLPWLFIVVWIFVLPLKWVMSGFPALSDFQWMVVASPQEIWFSARLVSVAAGTGTVATIMLIARDLTGSNRASILAGLLMATSFHHGMIDHFARVWPMTVFLWWLGLYFSWRIYQEGGARNYRLAALAAGAGFAVNYVGVLVALSIGAAHLLRHRRILVDRLILQSALIVLLFVMVILAASWPNFVRLLNFTPAGGEVAAGQHSQPLFLLAFYGRTLLKSDAVLALIGLLGLPVILRRAPVPLIIFTASLLPYAILILTGYVDDDRYILPVTPVLAIAGGYLAMWPRFGTAIAASAVLIQGAAIVQLDRLLLREDTREVACRWVETHIPPDEGVISATRVPPEQTIAAIELERSLAPSTFNSVRQRRVAGKIATTGGCGSAREAIRLDQILPEALSQMGPESLVARLNEHRFRWFVTDGIAGSTTDVAKLLAKGATLAATVSPGDAKGPIFSMTDQFAEGSQFDVFRMKRLGPTVSIYRLP